MKKYNKKRRCERCGHRISDDEPQDRGTEWDYNDLCLDCAEVMDSLGEQELSCEELSE